jgi:hypothetical protein
LESIPGLIKRIQIRALGIYSTPMIVPQRLRAVDYLP